MLTVTNSFADTGSGRLANRIVALHKEHHGRGPSGLRISLFDDLLTVVMHDIYSAVETTLAAAGRTDVIDRQRREYEAALAPLIAALVEDEYRRPVLAFMHANHHDPDLSVEVFLLGPRQTRGAS